MRTLLSSLLLLMASAGCAGCGSSDSLADLGILDTSVSDLGLGFPDGGATDAGVDAATDAGADAATDAGADAATDAGVDAHVPESDCTNGVDDDFDNAADCADSDCVPAVLCVPEPGAGWSAPGQLTTGTTAPSCAAPYDTEEYTGNADLAGSAASCSACSCGAPTSASCTSNYMCERTSGCAGTCTAGSPSSPGCVESPQVSATYLPRGPLGTTGSCGATASTATVDAPTWGREARLCTASASAATGCPGGEVCVPRPASPAPACVVSAGNVACPADYTEREVFYGGFSDNRGCTMCTCGFSATGCSVAYTAYSAPGCTGTATATAINTCYTGDPASYQITHTAAGATCNPTGGGAPIGGVAGTAPSTVCCMP